MKKAIPQWHVVKTLQTFLEKSWQKLGYKTYEIHEMKSMHLRKKKKIYLKLKFSQMSQNVMVWQTIKGVPNAISRPIRAYFTMWLIRTNSYELATRKIRTI